MVISKINTYNILLINGIIIGKYNLPKLVFGKPIKDDVRVTLKGEADVLTIPRSSKTKIIIKYNI